MREIPSLDHCFSQSITVGLISFALLTCGCYAVSGDEANGDGGLMNGGDAGAQMNPSDGSLTDGRVQSPDMEMNSGGPYDLPPTTPCEVLAANWPQSWVDFEDEVLLISNEMRAQSQDCRTGGLFPPARPVESHELLVCAARRHSLDMIQRGFFDHLDPEGVGPDVRVAATGYRMSALGENIAAGSSTPAAVVQGWMDSDGHCRNIMQGVFEQLGVGYVKTPDGQFKHFWTQVFGTQ
jgi:uncharacterized protein YkwD